MFYLLWYIKAFLLFVFHSHLCLSWLLSDITNLPAMWETQQTWVPSWGQRIPRRRKWQSTPVFLSGKILWTQEPGGHSPQSWKWPSTPTVIFCHCVYHVTWCGGIVLKCLSRWVRPLKPLSPARAFYINFWPMFPPLSCSNQCVIKSYYCASGMSCKSVLTTFKLLSLNHILLTLLFTSVFVPI